MHTQALTQYGASVRLGHKSVRQSLPRLLTLYFEFGSKMVAARAVTQRLKVAQNQVRREEGRDHLAGCVCNVGRGGLGC